MWVTRVVFILLALSWAMFVWSLSADAASPRVGNVTVACDGSQTINDTWTGTGLIGQVRYETTSTTVIANDGAAAVQLDVMGVGGGQASIFGVSLVDGLAGQVLQDGDVATFLAATSAEPLAFVFSLINCAIDGPASVDLHYSIAWSTDSGVGVVVGMATALFTHNFPVVTQAALALIGLVVIPTLVAVAGLRLALAALRSVMRNSSGGLQSGVATEPFNSDDWREEANGALVRWRDD